MKFSDFLVEKKIISKNQLKNLENEAIKTGAFFDDLLLSKKIILERDLFKAKSEFLEVPLLDKIPENTPEDVLTLLPRETVDFYKMAPLSINRQEGVLEIGMVNPQDQQARQALQFLSRQNKFAIKIFLLTPSDFNNFVKNIAKQKKK